MHESDMISGARRAWVRLLRLGFRLLYHEMAFTYDLVSRVVSLGQWHDWQRVALQHLDAPPGSRVLELAHGTGEIQRDLRAAGYHAVGLDLSPQMGRIAARKLRRWGLLPPLVRARAQALPFPDGTFAAVVSTFPTEFIIDPFTLREVRRVLAPGGRMVVVFNGLLTRGDPASKVLETAYRVTGQRGPWPVDVPARLAEAGLKGEMLTEEQARSVVMLFVAEPG